MTPHVIDVDQRGAAMQWPQLATASVPIIFYKSPSFFDDLMFECF